MEVEMRRVGIAGIAEQPEHLACCYLIARLDAQAARLHVRIEGEASFSDIDDDMAAQRGPLSGGAITTAGLPTSRGAPMKDCVCGSCGVGSRSVPLEGLPSGLLTAT